MDQGEAKLMEKARKDDTASFEALVKKYKGKDLDGKLGRQ